uniref:Ig-like domain-containing protein n=1 Tax=Cyprinus carpio TaxID=7962 RepID=A0A8C1PGC5_CYPCA
MSIKTQEALVLNKHRCGSMRYSALSFILLLMLLCSHSGLTQVEPKAVVKVSPDQRVFRGETVTLTCDIQGAGDIQWTYSWLKDGSVIPDITERVYTITSLSDNSKYSCEAKSISDAVTLTLSDLPRSTLTLTPNSPVFTGETVNLKCVIESYSDWRWRNGLTNDWRYEWYKGRYSVMLQTSERYTVNRDTLTIRGATESDQGQYWCRGQRDGRPNSSQSSSAVSLTVKASPKAVLKVTPDQRVFRGETVTLTCDIQGAGDIQWTYSWFKDGSVIRDITERVYTITSVSDSAEYSCRGERSDSQRSDTSDAVTLTVSDSYRAALIVTPDSPVFTGERVILKCVIESYSNWRYEWYKDTDSVMLQTSERYTVNRDTLTISGATESDAGQFWCRGQRDERPNSSQSSSAVYLSVKALPRSTLTVRPDSPVFTGETISLKCVIESYSNWRYEWYKGRDSVMLQTSERYTVNRDTLTIRGVNESDQDQFWCRGHIDGRPVSSYSSSVYLTVTERPKAVVKVTPDQRVLRGETVTLTCDIQGAGDIQWTYSWFKDGNTFYPYRTPTAEISFTADYVSYSVKYSCRGERSDSQRSDTSAVVTLTVSDLKPKPELTSDPAGAALTGNTVTLTCHMNLSPGWDFYWYKYTLNSETKTQTNSYRVKIDSVSDGGQYWCRAGRGKPVYYTQYSDALWVNVTVSPKAVVTVRPDERVFRGETVTLRCDIKWGGDTEWTYRWETQGRNNQYTNSVRRISTQELNIISVEDFHSGKYTCTGQMGTQSSQRSDAVTLTVSAEAQAAVRVSPQPWLTEGDSVTLICEVTGSSTGWTFSWFRDDDHLSDSSRGAGGSYTLSPAALQHTGVYTCRAERGRPAYYTKNSNTQPLWITDGDVILESSVDPVIEGHTLTLHCLHRSTNSPILRADFYKDGSLVQHQTTGEMNITTVSKSHEGFYYCKTERGQSLHSWISVRVSRSGQISVFKILSSLLAACMFLLATVVLLFKCCRARVPSAEDQSQYSVREETST